jgi:hypothetical protein
MSAFSSSVSSDVGIGVTDSVPAEDVVESEPLDEELPHADADSASALTRKSAINFFFIKMNLLF